MRPAVIVHADDGRGGKGVRRLDHVVRIHRHVERAARLGGASERDDELRLIASRDLRRSAVPDCVAGDVDRVSRPSASDEKADDFAGERFDARRPVASGRRGYEELRAARAFDRRGLERRKAFRVSAEPRRADHGRERRRRTRGERAAAAIEIVEMLIVAEQHGVDRADIARRQSRPGELPQGDRALVFAGRVEGRVGQEPQAVEFDEHGRAADEGQGRLRTTHGVSFYIPIRATVLAD